MHMLTHLRQLLQRIPFVSVQRSRLLNYIQVLIALIFLVAVTAICTSMVKNARSNAAKGVVNRGAIASSIISRAAARAVDQPTKEDAHAALERVIYDIRAEEGLEFAFVVGPSRRAIAHSDNRKKGQIMPLGLPSGDDSNGKEAWPEEGFYYTTYPAQASENAATGTGTIYEFVRTVNLSAKAKGQHGGNLELHVGFSLPGFWRFAGSSLKRAAPSLALAFLLLIVGNYLAAVFVRPLSTLREETAIASQAEDDWQLDVDATGEIAEIAENWNQMVGHFQTSYEQVVQTRRDMEVRNRVMLYEKKRTEAIVDSLSDGVMVTDAYGKVSFVNREAENLLGIERDGAIDRRPHEVIQDKNIIEFVQPFLDAAGSEGAGSGHRASTSGKKHAKRAVDLEVKRKNGTRHFHIAQFPVLDNTGKPGGAITTFRDITQTKLEERARKEFVSSVTHELRAPLTAIKSYVEMLIDDETRDRDLQREFFNTINEEADRLARLIDDMLNMSKIEVGNLVLNKSIVRTRKLIEDAVKGVRSAAKNKSIELEASITEDLPDVQADKDMVRVVVTNLLGNGIKYTQEGGKVFLNAELTTDPASAKGRRTIALTVEDNGPGIPEDELDKIFEKFYRGKTTAGQKVVGNGLGLALAREIATLHGGDIKVASTLGEGSKFTFLLPAAETSRKVS